MKFAATLEYDGTNFSGFQRQKNATTIQQMIEESLKKITDRKVTINYSGRTDAGVHAISQVFDFETEIIRDNLSWIKGINSNLPKTIAVKKIFQVPEDFDSRFSAIKRHYKYGIINRRAPLTFDKGKYWRVGRKLNIDPMITASKYLIGHHDFTTFRSSHCQSKSPFKTIDEINIEQINDTISIRISAKSFLHNQVRSIVGSLKLVGEGKWDQKKIKEILDKKDRTLCGPVAPAEGLILERVDYA